MWAYISVCTCRHVLERWMSVVCKFFFERLFDTCSFCFKFGLDLNVVHVKPRLNPKLRLFVMISPTASPRLCWDIIYGPIWSMESSVSFDEWSLRKTSTTIKIPTFPLPPSVPVTLSSSISPSLSVPGNHWSAFSPWEIRFLFSGGSDKWNHTGHIPLRPSPFTFCILGIYLFCCI